jgi:hypothetical protein
LIPSVLFDIDYPCSNYFSVLCFVFWFISQWPRGPEQVNIDACYYIVVPDCYLLCCLFCGVNSSSILNHQTSHNLNVFDIVTINEGQSRWEIFLELLKTKTSRPKKEVLDRIAEHHYNGIDSAASSADRAVAFYEMIRDLPSTHTRVVLQQQLSLHINGPVSIKNPNILTAVDEDQNQFIVKLLRPSNHVSYDVQRVEMVQERETCVSLGLEAPPVALCPVEVIPVAYEGRDYIALKMPRYLTTLYDNPKAFHATIVTRGYDLVGAIQYMHERGFVHMDIKSDNIFVGADKTWVLGDFGSSKPIGGAVTSCNLSQFVNFPLVTAQPMYDWFMLLLVLIKESLDDKNSWIGLLCDADEKYDPNLINQYIVGLPTDSPLQTLFLLLQSSAGSCAEV